MKRCYFNDRDDAGRRLGAALRVHADDRPLIVLALPPGGVPIGAHVAEVLDAPLDLCLIRTGDMTTDAFDAQWAAYRGPRPFPILAGETVVLVDEGAATGASLAAAIASLRPLGPRAIVAAVPVLSRDAADRLAGVSDDVIYLVEPKPFRGIAGCYKEFADVTDGDVRRLLDDAARRWGRRGPTLASVYE